MAGNKNSGRRTDPQSMRVASIAREHTEAALKKLVDLMFSAENEQVQLSAANALLDRGWGKPPQAITGEDGGPVKMTISWMPVQG